MLLPGEMIPSLIKDVENPVGIELGTFLGVTTEYLLSSIPTLKLYGIDPYTSYIDWNGSYEHDLDRAYDVLVNKVQPFGDRYFHYRKTSDEAVSFFDNNTMDFVFVDGLHTYQQVIKDVKNYYPKVKSGGLFCGHDFKVIEGVQRAVVEFAQQIGENISYYEPQDVWFWFKK